MNQSFRSIWSDAASCWLAVAETTRARGKRSGSRVAMLGIVLAALSAGTVHASVCGDGSTVAAGGTCAVGSYSPTVNDNLAGSATVSGGDAVHVSGAWSGNTGDAGYTRVPLGSAPIVAGNPNQPLLALGGKTQSISAPDPITGGQISVATYDSANFVASNAGATLVPLYHDVNGGQYVDTRIGTVSRSGGTLDVEIGRPADALSASGNSIEMAAKQTDLAYADGTGAVPSTVNWNSRNLVSLQTGDFLADGGRTGSYQLDVPTYAGTFRAFDGSTWTVTDAASLAAYNDFLVQSVRSGTLGTQAAYDNALGQAVTLAQQAFQYTNDVSASDKNTLPIEHLSVMHGTGANATLHIGAGGQIDFRGTNTIVSSSAVLAENGAHFVNDGRLSGDFTLVRLTTGASGINNGVISSGYAAGDNFATGGIAQPDNFGFHAYTEGNGVEADGAGTRFVNHGIMNVGAWNLVGNQPDLQSYAVSASGGASASNAGTINVGVNATSLDSQVIGARVAGGSFTNEAGGTIYLGRAAQYDAAAPEAASDVALSAHAYGILLGATGTATNLGAIVVGSQTQGAAGMASIGSTSGTLINGGTIVVNGAARGTPLANAGMLADNTAAIVLNTGTITLNGVNGIGIKVVGTSPAAVAATSTGTIDVAGGVDPASGTRNYGVWAEGPNATATLDGPLRLTGTGAIGAHARSGATIVAGANAAPQFVSGTQQIGFYAYGAGSKIAVAAQTLAVGTDDSTLFRVAGGAAYSGASAAGASTLDVDGQRARGVVATGAGTTLSTGGATYRVNGVNGVAITVEGGATGTIDTGARIDLNAAGAVAGIVDGQAHDLSGAATGAPVATALTSDVAVTSGTAGVTGFVARNLGTLANRNTVLLTGTGSTGVVVGTQGSVNNASTIRVANGTGALIQGATATLANTGVIAADDGVAAVRLTGAGTSVALSGAGSIVAGGSAHGVLIDSTVSGGTVAAGATTIHAGGAGHGIDNLGANSAIALAGTRIAATGAGSDGLSSTGAGARISADAATVVTTAGDEAAGFAVSGVGSTLTAAGTAVATAGRNAAAIVIDGGSATLASATIRTTGAQADGLVARAGGRIADTGSSVVSAVGNGATADSGGVLTLMNTALTGATAGIATSDTLANGATNRVAVDGGSVTSTTGPAFAANGGTADIAVRNATRVTAGNGTLLSLANGSNVRFAASAANLAGDIVSDATSIGNVFLANGTTLTGAIDPVALTIDGTSTWNITANSTLSSLSNAGTVAFVAPAGDPARAASYKSVTTGSYVGNGGTLRLNTDLGADTSPTDRLIVNGGTATGTSALKIANTAGTGAQTTGDGIQVVAASNGASTAASAFHLAAPVQAGAYEYLLYRGGRNDAHGWYLRSKLESTDPATPADSVKPATVSTTDGGGQSGAAAYRPGVVGYALTPSLDLDYGFSMLGKLHERVGDIANVEQRQPGNRDGIWARIGGQSLDANAGGRFAADERTFFVQFGKNWTLDQARDGGSTHAGVMATIGTSNASFSDAARAIDSDLSTSTGSVQMHAQSVGGYWTRYLPGGAYFDGVGQVTHYGNRYRDSYGNEASQNGFGVALSGEVGKPFAIGATTFAIEPQAQLMVQYLKLNGFRDNVSAVSGTAANALRGRAGVRVFRPNLETADGSGAATPYFTADVLHDFLSPGQTVVGGTPFATGFGRTWYELGIGVSASLGKTGELYANAKYARNLDGSYRRGVVGQVGYRYSW